VPPRHGVGTPPGAGEPADGHLTGTGWRGGPRLAGAFTQSTDAGGEPVRTEELRVTVDSIRRETAWSGPVRPDDGTRVAAGEGTVVRSGGRGNRAVVVERRP